MSITLVPCTWRALPAWRLIGTQLEAVVTQVGGHLASITRRGETVDPFWQPSWPGVDPAMLDAAHIARLGGAVAAPLLGTIVGSTLCCDRFGPPRTGEDKPAHGETCRTVFMRLPVDQHDLSLAGRLPQAALTVQRSVRLVGDTCVLATTVRHHGGATRDIEWCEHTNIGGDFLDGVAFAAPVDRVVTTSVRDPAERFGAGPEGRAVDVAAALAFPPVDAPPCGGVLCARLAADADTGTWTATNARLRRRLTCTFRHADWPWLALWTQHRARSASPWNGVERVRGMELSTKPFPEGDVPPSRQHRYLDRPTTCLIPPGAGVTKVLSFTWD